MQQCPNCGHNNRAGIIFCEKCGTSLIGHASLSTKALDATSDDERALTGMSSAELKEIVTRGNTSFKKGAALRLEISGSAEPITLQPKPDTIFGRRDPATGAMPDVDLTPYAGYRMGVSRRHAAIRHGAEETLELWDLGSSNGTFLNGQRLSSHRPYLLHDGDELRLGQMVIRVFYSLAAKSDIKDEPLGESAESVKAQPEKTSSQGGAKPAAVITEHEVPQVPDPTIPKRPAVAPTPVKNPPEDKSLDAVTSQPPAKSADPTDQKSQPKALKSPDGEYDGESESTMSSGNGNSSDSGTQAAEITATSSKNATNSPKTKSPPQKKDAKPAAKSKPEAKSKTESAKPEVPDIGNGNATKKPGTPDGQ